MTFFNAQLSKLMVSKEKEKIALKAIHNLLVQARWFSGSKHPHKKLFDFLDGVEYLPALMLQKENQTVHFESYLKGICKEHDCMWVWTHYQLK